MKDHAVNNDTDRPIVGDDDVTDEEYALLGSELGEAAAGPALPSGPLDDIFEKLTLFRQIFCKTNTDRQKRWTNRVDDSLVLVGQARDLERQRSQDPENYLLGRLTLYVKTRARLEHAAIMSGFESYVSNYEEAHGVGEERRERWRDAYSERVLKETGRITRKNKRRSEMSPAEWENHKREQRRVNKQRYRLRASSTPADPAS
jgi:hypothetical protein